MATAMTLDLSVVILIASSTGTKYQVLVLTVIATTANACVN